MNKAPLGYFEDLYSKSSDPWDYWSSDYERDKRRETVSHLRSKNPLGILEVGCSNGELAKDLSLRGPVTAIDFSPSAVAIAQLATREWDVLVKEARFPEDVESTRWDAVVASEVLYYLDDDTFGVALRWFKKAIEGGADVIVVSTILSYSMKPWNMQVNDIMKDEMKVNHRVRVAKGDYVLDVFKS